MGYDMRPAFYQEINPEDVSPPKGELVGCFRATGITELYLESSKLWHGQTASAPSANISTGQSRAMAATMQAAALPSTASTSPASRSVNNFWAYTSAQNRFSYRSVNGPLPEQQWPTMRGKSQVYIVERRQWRVFDFSARQWQAQDDDDNGDDGEDDDEDEDDSQDGGEDNDDVA
ncbi:hypothetical protein LTR56_026154 [Elasticomyces elasticus]|nr:hypothetical protein LTR56_026154 [Elasticomyces elasticus]KAK4893193.1 hypothetical protein LTR49_028513 [Elasticomyces elasticus]KAK5744895.1 hypothetical protein LTS12_023292 [Elasticomyces elasticus]